MFFWDEKTVTVEDRSVIQKREGVVILEHDIGSQRPGRDVAEKARSLLSAHSAAD